MVAVKKVLVLIAVVVVLALLIPISTYFYDPVEPGTFQKLAAEDAQFAKVAAILEEKCAGCHAENARMPIYANFPVAASMIEDDVRSGLRHLDLLAALTPVEGKGTSEVTLAKIEHVLEQRSMPPAHFLMVHWNGALSATETQLIRNWIRKLRADHYQASDVATEFAMEPVQPLPMSLSLDEAKVALGNRLYHDTRLSGDDTVSCATCHDLAKGGTDQSPTSTGIGGAVGPINAPTTYNSGLFVRQFWDGRAADLEEQAAGPVHNPIEMGSNWDQVIPKLEEDPDYVEAFAALYPAQGISGETIVDAIAVFERSLITPNARFDQFLRGDTDAITEQEKQGYELFKSIGCSNCHVGAAMGGQSFERMGLQSDYFADRGNVQEVDNGRFNFTKDEKDRFKFKVPSLRNIAVTYPYFHDGQTDNLKEAVMIMSKYQEGRELSDEEADLIVQFLKSLTGEYQGKPLQ
jgi:cytochrome c peroxidase